MSTPTDSALFDEASLSVTTVTDREAFSASRLRYAGTVGRSIHRGISMSVRRQRVWTRPVAAFCALGLAATLVGACSSSEVQEAAPDARSHVDGAPDASAPVEVRANVSRKQPVPVDRVVTVSAEHGALSTVILRSGDGGTVPGTIRDAAWTADALLEPGTSYVVTATAEAADGTERTVRRRFRTVELSLDQQVYPSVAPLQGETVGVGMPVIVSFDLPVTEREAVEKHLSVESSPEQAGAWRWISDTEVHWRPKKYWQPGTEVTVHADVNSVPTGEGRYGQESRTIDFTVGDAHIYKVNMRTHEMRVFSNGDLLRTFPITTGKDGFITRSGTKVIMEKFRHRRMRSETIGIPAGSAEGYDIDNVEYAMRLTYSGEFIHAAPWSVGSQGSANVSHGCTGMSTADAGWLYDLSRRGDVVQYVGSDRPMTLENGYGDWTLDFADWKSG